MSFAVPRAKKHHSSRAAHTHDQAGHAAGRHLPMYAVTPSRYFAWHAFPQRLAALLLLVPALPIMALLMLLIRLTSRGPGVYRQTRVGLAGRHFRLYKLRSMRLDAEACSGAVWAQLRGDPRVTPLGRFLRASHLDELPQLFNVLNGEMALVGPRPERPEFTHKLALSIPGYMERHAVRPGITGLAQINLPPDTDLESVRRKVTLDLEYINRGGLWLDLRILSATLLRLIALPNRQTLSFLRLHRCPHRTPHGAAPFELLPDEAARSLPLGALGSAEF